MRMGGSVPAMLFHEAQELNGLDDAKKAKLAELGKQLHEQPHDESKALHEEIVSEIRAGKIDQAKIDAKQADVEKAMKAQHDKHADALNQLHAALDDAQRKDVVQKTREHLKAREERMAKWKDKGKDQPKDGFAAHLTKELSLDDAQQKKVEAIVPKDDKPMDFEAIKKRNEALLDAFEKPDFDAKKLDDGAAPKMHGKMDAKFLAQLLPILKPEQREKLAADMSKGPMHAGPPAPSPSGSANPADDDGDD
jgi:Spy/CpxP family protein refolding chaperone